jgi:hypothetical protein
MSDEKKKTEQPLHLDMPFEEALERFAQTNTAGVEPPQGKVKKRPRLKMLPPRLKTLEPRIQTLSKTKPR